MLTPFFDLLAPCNGSYGYTLIQEEWRADLIARFAHADAELAPFAAAGFFAFERALADGAFPRAVVLKGQIIGLVTLTALLFAGRRALVDDPIALAAAGGYIQRLAV